MDDTISRQAAIDVFGDVHPLDYNAQAYLSKIKALPSAQPETHDKHTETHGVCLDDLIKRTDAIDAIEERIKANGYGNVALVSELNRLYGYIRKLPSAQQNACEYWDDESNFCALNRPSAQRKGKWIQKNKNLAPLNTIWWFECSECGKHAYNDILSEYCPNCGAEMVKGEEDETD